MPTGSMVPCLLPRSASSPLHNRAHLHSVYSRYVTIVSILSRYLLLPNLSLSIRNIGIDLSSNGLSINRRPIQGSLLSSSPIVPAEVSVSLRQLCALVDEVAAEEEVVCWGDGEGVAHEGCGVNDEGGGHLARDTELVLARARIGESMLNGATVWSLVIQDETYSSGLFWVSITAAIGIPKFETGPQKSELALSVCCLNLSSTCLELFTELVRYRLNFAMRPAHRT